MKDIDLVLVTENNIKIWELTLETLGVMRQEYFFNQGIWQYHVSYAPASYRSWISYGENRKGMNIMMISHGEGFSGGGLVYRV